MLDGSWRAPEASTPDRPSRRVAFGIIATVLMVATAKAQDAEPRSYTNTPVGLNFLIAGYVYSQGKIAFEPQLSIADAQFHTDTEALRAHGQQETHDVSCNKMPSNRLRLVVRIM